MGRHHGKQSQYTLAKAMFDYYQEGHSAEATGIKFGYSESGVRTLFRKHGFKSRPPGGNRREAVSTVNVPAHVLSMWEDYQNGVSLSMIASKHNCKRSEVKRAFINAELPV